MAKAKAGKRAPAAKAKAAPPAKRPAKRRPDALIALSIAAGDPLQPAGLGEYLAATGGDDVAAKRAKASRSEALRAAQARWSQNHPSKKTKG